MARTGWEEVAACNFCSNDASLRRHTVDDGRGRKLTLRECPACRLVWLSPRPSQAEVYKHYVAGTGQSRDLVDRKLARPNVAEAHRRVVEDVVRFAKRPVRALYDFGFGAGTVMMEARKLGLRACGHDVNKAAADLLAAEGFEVRHGFTHELTFGGPRYDAVVILDVLDRSYDPADDLRLCRDMLEDGGTLYVKTPFFRSPAQLAAGNGARFGNGRTFYFCLDTLRDKLESMGLGVMDVKMGQSLSLVAVKVGVGVTAQAPASQPGDTAREAAPA